MRAFARLHAEPRNHATTETTMPRHESALRPGFAPPFHHPYYASPRAEQRARLREEIAAFIDRQSALRARLARSRVLEVVR